MHTKWGTLKGRKKEGAVTSIKEVRGRDYQSYSACWVGFECEFSKVWATQFAKAEITKGCFSESGYR